MGMRINDNRAQMGSGLTQPEKKSARLRKQIGGGFCQLCQLWTTNLERHEITRGFARAAAANDPDLQLLICQSCHDLMGDYSIWSPERQLRWRLQMIVEKFNANRGRAKHATTLHDLAELK